ncbi:MAG: hypothetical protein JO069_10140 [Verrucomicrobia bacterium]|nr:hypothetical protein [Verrucomicrobiota bacterium]
MSGGTGPQQATTTQVQTMPGETAPTEGDYISARSDRGSSDPVRFSEDVIMRNRTGSRDGWRTIAEGFAFGSVSKVVVSNGHADPIVFVLTTDGRITKLNGFDSGPVRAGAGEPAISSGLVNATAVFVDPYDPNVIYVVDNGLIKSKRNGGGSWDPEPELTRLASNNGEYVGGCGSTQFCALQDMVFVRENPAIRIAVLWPSGTVAMSVDAGRSWTPITERLQGEGELRGITRISDLIAKPYSAFFIVDGGAEGHGVLYLALHGRGVIRLDGPFADIRPAVH